MCPGGEKVKKEKKKKLEMVLWALKRFKHEKTRRIVIDVILHA
jgi:hypothetical protein